MFEGNFKEADGNSATLKEIDGVLSTQSFEMLVQWVCLGRIEYGDTSPTDALTLSIEFARLTDMYMITGANHLMAERMKTIILADAKLHKYDHDYGGVFGTNVLCVKTHHIVSAASLPRGHPVREVLAMAMVEGFFTMQDERPFEETEEIPGFAADLLSAIKSTSKTIRSGEYGRAEFKEPLSGDFVRLIF